MTRLVNQKKVIPKPRRFHDHLKGKEGKIILATFQCIVEKGIAATSTYSIATKAGLNQGNIHYYFKSKEDLLQRVLEVFFENAISNIESILNSDLTPREKLEAVMDFGHSLIVPRRDEWIVFNAFWAHAMSVGGTIRQMILEHSEHFSEVLLQIILEGEKSGDFKQGVSGDIVFLYISAIQGLASHYSMDPDMFDPQGPIDLLEEIILN